MNEKHPTNVLERPPKGRPTPWATRTYSSSCCAGAPPGRQATHLMPLLQPGMDILDLGCGPGSITLGLAQAVWPGEVTGLDQNQEQVELARRAAADARTFNARFVTGNALALPFPDSSLDAVHCHGFLMHSPRIKEQLTEIVRVLKPGGILASRDMDVPSSFIAPAHESNRGMWKMLGEVIQRNGGNPWMGRQLKTFFINAGLEDVEPGYGADFFESPEDVAFLEKFLLEWALSQEFTEKNSETEENFNRWREQVQSDGASARAPSAASTSATRWAASLEGPGRPCHAGAAGDYAPRTWFPKVMEVLV